VTSAAPEVNNVDESFRGVSREGAIARWECDESGIPAIKDPYCGTEQAQFAACFERSARSGRARRP
jgi:hypothetical protein